MRGPSTSLDVYLGSHVQAPLLFLRNVAMHSNYAKE